MKIIEKKVTFAQEEDSCGRADEYQQYLHVETQDGGGGSYLVIKTDRWAIDPNGLDDFIQQLKSVLNGVEDI